MIGGSCAAHAKGRRATTAVLEERQADHSSCYTQGTESQEFVAILLPVSVGEWLSLVEHLVRDQGVGGSNPLSPTNSFQAYRLRFWFFAYGDVGNFVDGNSSKNHGGILLTMLVLVLRGDLCSTEKRVRQSDLVYTE